MATIVRGLWGNALLARRAVRPPEAFAHILRSVRDLKEREDITHVFYCYGQDNSDYLDYLGFENVVMLDQRSWVTKRVLQDFHHRWDGAWIYGCSYWCHKLMILSVATREYGDVLWIDCDIKQKQPVTSEVWDFLSSGDAAFRASLYCQRNWTWGAGWRRTKKWGIDWFEPFEVKEEATRAAQTVPGCGFLYVRNHEVAQEALTLQWQYPFWLDHQIFAYMLDRWNQRWIGPEEYVRQGYHTDFYYYGRQLFPPSEDRTIWQAGERFAKGPL